MNAVEKALEEVELQLRNINEATAQGNSAIQNFYRDSVIFVTGANGFMGKLLVEKLLRSCNVKKIFILLREKKGKTALERLDDMKRDPLFDSVREVQPDFGDKIAPVEGDVASIRLGIGDQAWRILTEEVHVIFHLAATTRFDESLRNATLINTRGTREVLHLTKQCLKLRVFVHVSTAYCHATTDKIGVVLNEEFYPCPVPPDTLIKMAETLDTRRLEALTPQLMEGWPNTYTLTKAVAEELVRNMPEELPICIVRAPIVISTYCEPVPGWLDTSCIYGPSGMILAVGLGFKHLFCVKVHAMLCLMPGDYVNNTVLAAAWDTAERIKQDDKDIKIYTISSTRCGVNFLTVDGNMRTEVMRKYSSPKAIGYCWSIFVESKLLYRILAWFLHYIPAFVVDLGIQVFKMSKPNGIKSFVEVYKKIDKMEVTYDYFLRNGWRFDDKNVVKLHQKMSPVDQTTFNIDATTIKWDYMIFLWSCGIKKYITKESISIDKDALKKQKMFKIANFAILFVYLYMFYNIFYLFYSFFQ